MVLITIFKCKYNYVSDPSCPDIQMGFCMETTGMTESDEHAGLEMAGVEDPGIKDYTESIDDERDPEVGKSAHLICLFQCK